MDERERERERECVCVARVCNIAVACIKGKVVWGGWATRIKKKEKDLGRRGADHGRRGTAETKMLARTERQKREGVGKRTQKRGNRSYWYSCAFREGDGGEPSLPFRG